MREPQRFEVFRVGDVFEIIKPNQITVIKNTEPGNIPLVSSQKNNNGVIQHIKRTDEPNKGNRISVSYQLGRAFYQHDQFYCTQDAIIIKPSKKDDADENVYIYLCTLIDMYAIMYGFKNKRSHCRLMSELIRLPVIESDDPAHVYTPDDIDWDYMHDYIQQIKEKYERRIIEQNKRMLEEYRRQAGRSLYEPDDDEPAGFGVFMLSDIFDIRGIRGGTYTNKANLVPGDYRYVTGTSQNNGNTSITCGNSDRADRGNCITVSETGGGPFYQPFDFVGYGPITVLRREGLNEQQYLYVCACMSRQNIRYGFNQGRTGKQIRAEKIALPVKEIKDRYTPDDIDWDYMGRHIASVELHAVQKVEEMQKKTETIIKKTCAQSK